MEATPPAVAGSAAATGNSMPRRAPSRQNTDAHCRSPPLLPCLAGAAGAGDPILAGAGNGAAGAGDPMMRSPHAARWRTAAAATRNRLLRGRRATYDAAILCSRCAVEDRRRRPLPLLHPGSGRRRRHCDRRSATLKLRYCNRPAASAGAAPLMQFYCLSPSVGVRPRKCVPSRLRVLVRP